MKTIAIIASLDTKGAEVRFLKERIERLGCRSLVIDVGVWAGPAIEPDVHRQQVAAAGGWEWSAVANGEKHERIAAMTAGAPVMALDLYSRGAFDAILSIGGLQNTVIGVAAMQALPIGVPKVMVSTVASGRRMFGTFVGSKDICMMPAIADIEGINVLTSTILANAAAAVVGMAMHGAGPLQTAADDSAHGPRVPIIGATQMGVTNGVSQAARLLEKDGYQVISFHSTGAGGRAMEELIAQGTITAVLDLTVHEIVAEMFDGGFSAGATNRLTAACEAGIPQVVAPGGADFIDFGIHELPADMDLTPQRTGVRRGPRCRKYILHNSEIAHIKLHREEIVRVANILVERLNRNCGPVTVMIPLRGFRQATLPGQPLHDPAVDGALIEILRRDLNPAIRVVEIDANINDLKFSEAAAAEMRRLLTGRQSGETAGRRDSLAPLL